jgi:hypothetical protein
MACHAVLIVPRSVRLAKQIIALNSSSRQQHSGLTNPTRRAGKLQPPEWGRDWIARRRDRHRRTLGLS